MCSQAKVLKPDGSTSGNASKLRLDLCQWQLAWDRHMIGAAVVDQVGLRFSCAANIYDFILLDADGREHGGHT